MKSSSIQLIENYVNANRDSFNRILKRTKYEKLEIFSFLPGHVALILSLPEFAKLITPKQRSLKKIKYSETRSETTNEGANEHHTRSELGETAATEKLDEAIIRERLISKINKFTISKQIVAEINENHIIDFRYEDNSFKCSVHCVFCGKKIPCKYVKYWLCGNYQAHLKKHDSEQININQFELDIDGTSETVSTSIIKINNSRIELIDNVLNLQSTV